jgi:predicted ATPase
VSRFVRQVGFTGGDREQWPFCLGLFAGLERLTFTAPVTVLVGENGSGKSTLLEAMAIALRMPAIGRADAHRDPSLAELVPLARSLRLVRGAQSPQARFFLRSEDFFGFVQTLGERSRELREELDRARRENAHRSRFAQQQAEAAYSGSLAALQGRYGADLLGAASHGESFLRLFQARMAPRGLYLMDEPEAPLSPVRQLALMQMIRELAEQGQCQFILATHSPILMALPGAQLIDCDQSPLAQTVYGDLASVALLREFLNDPSRMIDLMAREDP